MAPIPQMPTTKPGPVTDKRQALSPRGTAAMAHDHAQEEGPRTHHRGPIIHWPNNSADNHFPKQTNMTSHSISEEIPTQHGRQP